MVTRKLSIHRRRRISVASLFLCLGLVTGAWGTMGVREAQVSRHWPTTLGRIGIAPDAGTSEVRTFKGRITYTSKIQYHYVVNGRRFTGERVSFAAMGFEDWEFVNSISRRYPVGTTIEVTYDPTSPENAVLHPGLHWSRFIVLGLGALMVILAGRRLVRG